jgi:glycosyltransferase involved in cell wall biosynthesis
MWKVGICGHFGEGKQLLNGQTIKTKMVTNELEKQLGEDSVKYIDTHNWRKKIILLLLNCYRLLKTSENIIIMPAQNGVKVFIPLFLFLNIIRNRKIHYVVIGGWLPDFIKDNKMYKWLLSKIDCIYVETNSMVVSLNELGLKNVYYLPNFKQLKILTTSELVFHDKGPYNLCTFSRVAKEKGIEDAIDAVKKVNSQLGTIVYTLDIYGQIAPDYKERFNEIQKNLPDFIKYKGMIDFDKSVDTLKNYFALVFPTYYQGEGFAGTVIDAYASGIPVIATNWKYNNEVIKNNRTGLLYNYKTPEKLSKLLLEINKDSNLIHSMKIACINEANKYSSNEVIKLIINQLK